MACKAVADQNVHKHYHVSAPPEHDAAYFVHSKSHSRLHGRLCMAGPSRNSNRAHTDMCLKSLRGKMNRSSRVMASVRGCLQPYLAPPQGHTGGHCPRGSG